MMKIELNEQQAKTTKTGEVTFDLLLKYLLCLISTFTKTLVYVHPKSRRQLMDDIEYPGLKDTMLPALDQMKDVWIAPLILVNFPVSMLNLGLQFLRDISKNESLSPCAVSKILIFGTIAIGEGHHNAIACNPFMRQQLTRP